MVICCSAGAAVQAQRADSVARRDSANRRVQTLPAVFVITGSLTPMSSNLLGVARATLTRSALDAEPTPLAVNALRQVAGVYIDESNGPLGPTVIRVRGGEEQFTQILVDGVQLNEQGGFFDAQGITLVNVDRLEIARGPQSTVYGTSAMSGAVQMLSPTGEPGAFHTQLTLEGARTSEHGGNRRAVLENSGGTDLLRYSAGLGRAFDRGIYRLPNDLHSDDASTRVDFVPRSTLRLTTVARYSGTNSLLPVEDPGVNRAPLDPNQRQGRNRIVGLVEAAWSPSQHWSHKVTIADYHRVFTYDNTKDAIDTVRYPVGFFNANYHYHDVVERVTARYVGTVTNDPTASVGLAASFGGEWERESLKYDASGDFGPTNLSMNRPSTAAFAEGQLHVADRFSLLVGSRAESFRGVGAALVPRATAVYTLVPGRAAVRGVVAAAYKAPSLQDEYADPGFFAGNPDLKPETSRSAELGVDLTDDRASLSLTMFRQRYDGLIRIVPSGDKVMNANVGRTRASGVEAEATVYPRPRWMVGAQASWLSTEVVDNLGLAADLYPNGEPLPFRPAYTASGIVAAPVGAAFTVSARLSAVGRQTALSERFSGSRVSIDPYRVLGGTATYRASSSIDAYVHAENALNASFALAYDKPGAPRSVSVGVRIRQ
jgi:vitamin B12 transporter